MITTVIGLGNPGPSYAKTRHNIGFMVLDALAVMHGASWKSKEHFDEAIIQPNGRSLFLIKPTTFMNNSGNIVPELAKRGIKAENVIVLHDELELPFGKIVLREAGSAKGHNGLRSLISRWGEQFKRLRIGIGRPERRDDVPDYVLSRFLQSDIELEVLIKQAIDELERCIQK